jgi:hypothetical protein
MPRSSGLDAAGTPEERVSAAVIDGAVPQWQYHARTYVDLPGHLEASALYFGATEFDLLALEGRSAVNLGLAWRPTPHIDISAGVQNLFHDGVIEPTGASSITVSAPVRTTPFAQLAWRF